MKKITFLTAAAVMVLFSGCAATEKLAEGLAQKTVSGAGTFAYSNIGLDAATQTPELSSLFVWGDYASVVSGQEVLRFEQIEDASIFNSSSKKYQTKIFYCTGDQARMDALLQQIKQLAGSKVAAGKMDNTAAINQKDQSKNGN